MLVISRMAGESVAVDGPGEGCLVTALKILPDLGACLLLISHASGKNVDLLESWPVEAKRDQVIKVGRHIAVQAVDIRGDKVRLGIDAPKEYSVHRLEVTLAIRRENRSGRIDPDEDPPPGSAGARVPRPSSPKLPELDVRLDEPNEDEQREK